MIWEESPKWIRLSLCLMGNFRNRSQMARRFFPPEPDVDGGGVSIPFPAAQSWAEKRSMEIIAELEAVPQGVHHVDIFPQMTRRFRSIRTLSLTRERDRGTEVRSRIT
jgi:hypothetical protein